jgi:hypothetical protein
MTSPIVELAADADLGPILALSNWAAEHTAANLES